MAETAWTSKKVGDPMLDTAVLLPEISAVLFSPGGMVPDWIKDPYGNKVRVLGAQSVGDRWLCGKCRGHVPATEIVFVAEVHQDATRVWYVYQCQACGFVWEQHEK